MAEVRPTREIQDGETRGNSSDQVLWKKKHNAKILSICLGKFDEKSQNYPSISVHVKQSLGEFKRSLPEILSYA